jgi:hypothetical protein
VVPAHSIPDVPEFDACQEYTLLAVTIVCGFSTFLYLENTIYMGTDCETTIPELEPRVETDSTRYLTVEAERTTMLAENAVHYTGPVVIKSEVSTLPGKSACERLENPAVFGRSSVSLPDGPFLAELLQVKSECSPNLQATNRDHVLISAHVAKTATRSSRVRLSKICE